MAFLKRITGLQMPNYNFTKYYVPADVKFEVYLKKKKTLLQSNSTPSMSQCTDYDNHQC